MPSPPGPQPLVPPSSKKEPLPSGNVLFTVVLAGCGLGFALIIVFSCFYVYRRWSERHKRYQSMKAASLQLSTVFRMERDSDDDEDLMTLGMGEDQRLNRDQDDL